MAIRPSVLAGSSRRLVRCRLALLCAALVGLGALPARATPHRDFTIVIFGDTQKMVRANGSPPSRVKAIERARLGRFERMIDWILDHREDEGIELVLHVGDAINAGVFGRETAQTREEWARFDRQWKRLDGVVPYLVARGNHDNRAEFARHYGAAHFRALAAGLPGLELLASSEREDAHVLRLDLGGQPTLVMSVSCYPPDDEIELLRRELREHPDLPAVIVSHIITAGPGLHPASTSKSDPDCSGERAPLRVWDDLVVPHAAQVVLTASGHFFDRTPGRSGSKVVEQVGGSRILDTFQNFQPFSDSAAGYALTLVRVQASDGTISVDTYSPVEAGRGEPLAQLDAQDRMRLAPTPFVFAVTPSPAGAAPGGEAPR